MDRSIASSPSLLRGALFAGLAGLLLATIPALTPPALASEPTSGTFLLDLELYRGLEAPYGTVQVEEDGDGGLHFSVELDPAVAGSNARVHGLFLSVDGWPEGVSVVPDDPGTTRMRVHPQRRVWSSFGADFGMVVSVSRRPERGQHLLRHPHRHHGHRHAGHPHPGRYRHEPMPSVGFTLTADEPLGLSDVLGMAATWRGHVTQIGVRALGSDVGRHRRAPALLGGLFEPTPPDDGGLPGGVPAPDDTVPPGCLGTRDPVTGELTIFCP